MRSLFACAIVAAAGISASAQADLIANWTFEGTVPVNAGPHTAEGGVNAASSYASGFHNGASTYSNPSGNGTAESFSSTNWVLGDYYQFTTSTSGYQSISVTWDQVSSNTGPRDFTLMGSIDGVNFTQVGAAYSVLANAAPNAVWTSGSYNALYTFNRAAAASFDSQVSVTFRMVMASNVSANGGTVASGGTDRVDSVMIEGTRIPTAGSLGLLGFAGLATLRRRR
jgi:hypothetical protein